MKEAIIHPGTKVEIIDSPIPKPGPGQVVIKVVFSGSNPKDWKGPEWSGNSLNQGDDIAGIVSQIGSNVSEFRAGDRVAALHELRTPGGSYAEYALSWAYTTFPFTGIDQLPGYVSRRAENYSCQDPADMRQTSTVLTSHPTEAAALPLAAMTAAVGLYARLRLPPPWLPAPASHPLPLVIYGASSAVGSYAIQFAQRSNIHPLICVAGRAREHVESLIDRARGDTIVDYRKGDTAVVQGIRDALWATKLEYAFDAVSDGASCSNICQVLERETGKITLVLPGERADVIPASDEQSFSGVADAHHGLEDFCFVFFRYLGRGLEEGWLKPQPQEVIPGGLAGVEEGLTRLRDGKASAVKYVFHVQDTPGVER